MYGRKLVVCSLQFCGRNLAGDTVKPKASNRPWTFKTAILLYAVVSPGRESLPDCLAVGDHAPQEVSA